MNKKFLYFFFILVICGCFKSDRFGTNNLDNDPRTLTISAAISLKDVFDDFGEFFEAVKSDSINVNYGSSGALQRQIENGAPVDLFASASERQMDELEKGGFIEPGTRKTFAANSLVLIVPRKSELKIQSFGDLSKPEVQKIAVGNPKTVPAGQYAEESLTKMNLKNAVQPKLILAENVRQVLDYVVRGEVDAGIVYATDARSAELEVKVAATADETTHSAILYSIAVIKNSKQKVFAEEFIDLFLAETGTKILIRHGFEEVSQKDK